MCDAWTPMPGEREGGSATRPTPRCAWPYLGRTSPGLPPKLVVRPGSTPAVPDVDTKLEGPGQRRSRHRPPDLRRCIEQFSRGEPGMSTKAQRTNAVADL